MAHFLYIIHSEAAKRYYVGESVDPHIRVQQHNAHAFKGSATTMASDWLLKVVIPCEDRAHARALEKWVKSQKSTAIIKRLINEQQYREYQVARFRKPPSGA